MPKAKEDLNMLRIESISTHMSASCQDATGMNICAISADTFGNVVNGINISAMSSDFFVKNLDLIKEDVCAFIDGLASKLTVIEEPEVEVELPEEELDKETMPEEDIQ